MVMYAEILAIGPFNSDIAQFLQYPLEMYKNTNKGCSVVANLFGIAEGTGISSEFALLLGVTDPWDFNQHKLDPENFNFNGLDEFVEMYDDYKKDLVCLRALIKGGFKFHFLPNG